MPEESSPDSRRQLRLNMSASLARLRAEVQAQEEQRRQEQEALAALRERLNDSGSEPGAWVSTVVDNNGQLLDVETSEPGPEQVIYDEAAFLNTDAEIRRLNSDASGEFTGTYDEAYDETVNPDNFDYERAEDSVLNAYSLATPDSTRLSDEQLELLRTLTRDNQTATGREANEPVTGGTRRRAESDAHRYSRLAPGGLVTFGNPASHPPDGVPYFSTGNGNYNFTYDTSRTSSAGIWQNVNWEITHHETEGDTMPRIDNAPPPPLAERLTAELSERQQGMARSIAQAIRAAEQALSNLREARGYVEDGRNVTVSDLEEAKYLVRNTRDYTASVSRLMNPAPAAFTNMIRLSRNLAEQRTRIEAERQEARAEERQEIFREAVAASEEYVPAVGDYLRVTSLSRGPLEVREVYPDVDAPENVENASVLMHTPAGPIGTRSVAWLRRNEMEQVTRDTPPVPATDTRYVPVVGDTIVLPRGMSGRNGTSDITEFRVEHITRNTSVFDDDGCPNPEVRLEAVARPGAFWTRRLARLRELGMRPAFPGNGTPAPSADYILQIGDRFTVPNTSVIDLDLRSDVVFTVREIDPYSAFNGVELWFTAEGRSYRYLRSMDDLRRLGYELVTTGIESGTTRWCPMVGDRVTFNGRSSLHYMVDEVNWDPECANPEIRFHAITDRREDPYPYTYRLEHLHGLEMQLVIE